MPTTNKHESLISVQGIGKGYLLGGQPLQILKDVCLDIFPGESCAIVGASGSVKAVRVKDGPVVGMHMIGRRVSELVGEAQLIVNWEAYPEDVASLIHGHPSQHEAMGEAALALAGKPLHAHA